MSQFAVLTSVQAWATVVAGSFSGRPPHYNSLTPLHARYPQASAGPVEVLEGLGVVDTALQQGVTPTRRKLIFDNIVGAHALEHMLGPHTVAVLLPAIYAEFGLTGVQTGLAARVPRM